LGCNLARDNNWRSMATRGSSVTHQSSGTESSLPGTISLIQVHHSSATTHLLQMDNSTAVAYINKRGGTQSHTLSIQATDLWAAVLNAGSWVTAKHIPGTSNEVADTASRQFKQNQQPASPVCVSISRPRSGGNGRVPLRLESVEELDISSSGSDSEDLEKTEGRQSYGPHPGSSLERTALVPYTAGHVSGLPQITSSTAGTDQTSLRPGERASPPSQTAPNRMACIREGLSQAATDILLSSWSKATQKRYAGPWKAWSSWCAERGLCPLTAPVNEVLNVLAGLFQQQQLSYRTI
jgi:hypothetical protein